MLGLQAGTIDDQARGDLGNGLHLRQPVLPQRFAGWELLQNEVSAFEAPGNTVKRFATVIARKPA